MRCSTATAGPGGHVRDRQQEKNADSNNRAENLPLVGTGITWNSMRQEIDEIWIHDRL